MAAKDNPIDRDPSSGRPMMKDIVSKSPRVASQKRVEKAPREIPKETSKEKVIPIRKKELAKVLPKNPFFEPRKVEVKPVESKKSSKAVYVTLGAIVLLVGLFFALKAYSSAIVTVTPRQSISDAEITLAASSDSVSDLSMEIVSAEDTINIESPLPEGSKDPQKAMGQIIIFNAFSTQAQTLVSSTRFEAPGGKIYRIQKGVTVPGGKMSGGKITPGQIEVTVYADKAGVDYNLGLSDFTIPGFKGTIKYDKIYARSKTEITGGSAGGGKVVSQSAVESILKAAEDDFRESIKEKIQRDLPEGIFIPDESIEILITADEINPALNSPADIVKIKAHASAKAMVLKRSEISEAISSKYLDLGDGEEVNIENLDNLNFDVTSADFEARSMTVKISSKVHYVWQFDNEKLTEDLIKASKSERKDVFKAYSSIERAEIKYKPSWFPFFPTSKSNVDIQIELGQNS